MFLDADEQEEDDTAKGQVPTRQGGAEEGGANAGGAAAEEGTGSTDAETASLAAPPTEQEP